MKPGKLIIFSAPSGSGKSTIVKHLIERGVPVEFSISACSRAPRGDEKHGVDYYFLSPEEFKNRVKANVANRKIVIVVLFLIQPSRDTLYK